MAVSVISISIAHNCQWWNQPAAYQILVGSVPCFIYVLLQTNTPKAINIIAKLSFWIRKPFKISIMEALGQFKEQGYVNKLKTQIPSEVLPTGRGDLFRFLHDQIKNIWRFVMNYIFTQEKCLLLNPPRLYALGHHQSCQWHGFAKFLSFLYQYFHFFFFLNMLPHFLMLIHQIDSHFYLWKSPLSTNLTCNNILLLRFVIV